jgi:hypothetical protein
MENVTYTKNQLADFTVKELKTLPLFAKIDPKGLDKAGIVNAIFKAQEEANEPQTKEVEEAKSEAIEVEATDEVNTEKEEIQSEKSEKVVFHRGNNIRRNPMTFR